MGEGRVLPAVSGSFVNAKIGSRWLMSKFGGGRLHRFWIPKRRVGLCSRWYEAPPMPGLDTITCHRSADRSVRPL